MFYNQKKYKLSLYYIFLFVLVSVLTQSRGAIISVFSIFMIYFYHEEKIKIQSVILITLLLVTFYFIVNIYLPDLLIRFEEGLQQITNLNNINYNYNLTALRFQGTFIFRIGILYERFIFVLQHLSTIILGVGFIPDMDIMLPIFKLGTHSPTLPTGFEQFNTVDIFYPNIITRYGIIGSIIYLYILLQIGKYAILHRKYMWGKILLSYLFALVSISFINETFYNVQIFLIIFMMIGYIIHEKQNMTLTKSNNNKKKYA